MRTVACVLLFVVASQHRGIAADWPQFRGPDGQGHGRSQDLPTEWSESKNVTWKTRVPGLGHSSPVVSGSQIWLTTAVDEGRSLRAVCLDRENGKIVHEVDLFVNQWPDMLHNKNSHATPTAVAEGDRVYVHFGANGTACLSRSGKVIWKAPDLQFRQPYAGASCPVLFENFLILTCDGSDAQFLVALDRRTGRVIWKTPRGHVGETRANFDSMSEESREFASMAYSTPLVIDVEGAPQLVSTAADYVAGYDPRTGTEIWWVGYDGFSLVARPMMAHGLIYVCGFENTSRPVLYAIRPGGTGDIRESHVAWKRFKGAPHVPSPVIVGEELYVVTDKGVAICINARSGKEQWTTRLGGNYSASLIYAGGKIYACSEEGKTAVFSPGKEYKLLATNSLDGRMMASPAAVDGALFLRTDAHLYRIDERGERSESGNE